MSDIFSKSLSAASPPPASGQITPEQGTPEQGVLQNDAAETPSGPEKETHDAEDGKAPETAPPSAPAAVCSTGRFFNFCSMIAPLLLLGLWFLQSLPRLLDRPPQGFYQLAERIQAMMSGGTEGATVTEATGGLFSSVEPISVLFLELLSHTGIIEFLAEARPFLARVLPHSPQEAYPALAAVLAGLSLLLLTWGLALGTGYGRQGALAAGCTMSVILGLSGLPPFAGEALLAGALMVASLLFLYSGWVRPFAPFRLGLGFALAGVTALSAGTVGLLIPLLTSVLFLAWRGTFRRAGAADGALGFGLMLVVVLGRAAWLFFQPENTTAGTLSGREELRLFIEQAFVEPFSLARETAGKNWWCVFPLLAVLCLPFSLLLPFLSWERIGTACRAFLSNRHSCPGHGWIWAFLLSSLLVFSLLGVNVAAAVPLLFAPVAILAGQALICVGTRRNRLFYLLSSLLLLALAVCFGIAGGAPLFTGDIFSTLAVLYPDLPQEPAIWYGMLAQGALCLVFCLVLWKASARVCSSGLLGLTFFAAFIALPFAWSSAILAPRSPDTTSVTIPSSGPDPLPDAIPAPAPDNPVPVEEMKAHPAEAREEIRTEVPAETREAMPEAGEAPPAPSSSRDDPLRPLEERTEP